MPSSLRAVARSASVPITAIVLLLLAASGGEQPATSGASAPPAATRADSAARALTTTFTDQQYRLADIKLGTIERRKLSAVISLNGLIDVEPSAMAVVSAPLGGYVRSAGLLPGTPVRKGQLLATLESPEFTQLQQDYLESKGRMLFLEQDFSRQEQLRRDNVNAAKTLQQVTSERAIMQARIAGLEQKMRQAGIPRSAVDSGRIAPVANLYAPIGGYIKSSNVSIGQHVTPTDVLFAIIGTSDLHLALNVYARDLERVRVGQTVRFGTADERTMDRTARVFLVGQATGEDRVFPVHGHLDARSARGLRPGMYVKAGLEAGGEEMDAVPATAVVQFEGNDYIILETQTSASGHTFRFERVRRQTEQGGYVGIQLDDMFDARNSRVVVGNAIAILAAIRNAEDGG
jgi:cobalt-zinc-cadmium efflux system membrane fusion protein